jgi:hypothetical protein
MGIERHRGGRAAALSGAATYAVDDLRVPAVQAVEVAQGEDRAQPPWRGVFRKVSYHFSQC